MLLYRAYVLLSNLELLGSAWRVMEPKPMWLSRDVVLVTDIWCKVHDVIKGTGVITFFLFLSSGFSLAASPLGNNGYWHFQISHPFYTSQKKIFQRPSASLKSQWPRRWNKNLIFNHESIGVTNETHSSQTPRLKVVSRLYLGITCKVFSQKLCLCLFGKERGPSKYPIFS